MYDWNALKKYLTVGGGVLFGMFGLITAINVDSSTAIGAKALSAFFKDYISPRACGAIILIVEDVIIGLIVGRVVYWLIDTYTDYKNSTILAIKAYEQNNKIRLTVHRWANIMQVDTLFIVIAANYTFDSLRKQLKIEFKEQRDVSEIYLQHDNVRKQLEAKKMNVIQNNDILHVVFTGDGHIPQNVQMEQALSNVQKTLTLYLSFNPHSHIKASQITINSDDVTLFERDIIDQIKDWNISYTKDHVYLKDTDIEITNSANVKSLRDNARLLVIVKRDNT